MQKRSAFISLVILLVIPFSLSAQRYLEEVFENTTRKTVVYQEKPGEKLAMDIFMPANDKVTDRPVLLYVHGGGFSGGRRDHPNHIKFCEALAKKGYVAITMSYSLVMKGKSFSCDQLAEAKVKTFRSAALDIAHATRYLVDNKSELGINDTQIVLAGSSAGAEAVLHAAYWKDTWKKDGKMILDGDFSYGGVISMAGAILDTKLITSASAIPTQLFHGTCDKLVPYATAPHHYCDYEEQGYLILHGAQSIANHLNQLQKSYYLVTGCNGGHEWSSLPILEYNHLITEFLYTDVLGGTFRQLHVVESNARDCTNASATIPSECSK